MIMAGAVIIYGILFWRSQASTSNILLDIGIFALGAIFWLFFFAQFVMPLRQSGDRMAVFDRLVSYLMGQHGPAIFIENGEVNERKGELQAKGPGVIFLDSASAAVLRTPVAYTRPVGPGVAFTRFNETIAGQVDLRLQKHCIGPASHENPFAPQQPNEEFAAYQARQKNRQDTRALTRDGIEIVPQITVYFRINSLYGEGHTEYGYNPSAVERAVIGRNIDLNQSSETPNRVMDWKWLPVYLAADAWKEYVSKFTLDDLFQKEENHPGAFKQILDMVTERLTCATCTVYDRFGKPTENNGASGKTEPLKENSEPFRLLQERGIKVTRVDISDLHLPETVEQELVQRWKASWLIQARRERELVEQRRGYVSEQGRQEARREYALAASRELGSVSLREELTGAEILKLLLQGEMEFYQRDPAVHTLANQDIQRTGELLEWVESLPEERENA